MVTQPKSVVLADDQHLVRAGMRCLLHTETEFRVVGESGDGLRVTALVKRLKPSLVLLDVALPGLWGLEVTRRVRQIAPAAGIVVLSRFPSPPYVVEALRNGANAFVAKQANPAELARALRVAMSGGYYLSRPLSRIPLKRWLDRAKALPATAYDSLTGRQREILQLVAEGHSNLAISERLGISVRTAEVHRARVLERLGVHSQADLIRYALARGIIPPPEPMSRPN
ncbi:MAG: response regulator [Candidatus Rokuibacteriota bacterium]